MFDWLFAQLGSMVGGWLATFLTTIFEGWFTWPGVGG